MTKPTHSRSLARERAFQLLFQLELQPGQEQEQVDRFMANLSYPPAGDQGDRFEPEEYPAGLGRPVRADDRDFILDIVAYVRANKDLLDELYSPYLKGWQPGRLPHVDRCILRMACYEIKMRPDIPFNVAVNEAVLLANKYGDANSRPYINAVLGRLKKVREEATAAAPTASADPPAKAEAPAETAAEPVSAQPGSSDLADSVDQATDLEAESGLE